MKPDQGGPRMRWAGQVPLEAKIVVVEPERNIDGIGILEPREKIAGIVEATG